MFRLINSGQNWYCIFLLLSIEKSDPILADVHFPTTIHLDRIRPTLRNFIEEHYLSISTPQYYEVQVARMNKIYSELLLSLDTAELEQLCQWGNQFEINTDLEKSVSAIWTFYLKPLPVYNYERMPLTEPSKEFMLSVFNPVMEREKTFLLKLDEYEELSKSIWEERAIWIYNGGTDYTPNVEDFTHPFDYFPVLHNWLNVPPALKKIQAKLDANEFEVLNNWLNAEFQKRNRTHLLDLQTILEQIESG